MSKMPTKTEMQARLDAIVTWMRDPANAERRALFCLVNSRGLWLVPAASAEFKLAAGSEHGFAFITTASFDDAVTAKDHNLANKIARRHNETYTGLFSVKPMRVGDAMDKAARSYASAIANAG